MPTARNRNHDWSFLKRVFSAVKQPEPQESFPIRWTWQSRRRCDFSAGLFMAGKDTGFGLVGIKSHLFEGGEVELSAGENGNLWNNLDALRYP